MSSHRLFLLRHAEAEGFGSRGDVARTLTQRGRNQAFEVGGYLREAGVHLVLTSPAVRARQTAEGLAIDAPIDTVDAFYHATTDTFLDTLASLPEDVTTVLLVGHAPAIPELAAELADDSSDPQALGVLRMRYPTATLAGLEFDGTWANLSSARLFLVRTTAY